MNAEFSGVVKLNYNKREAAYALGVGVRTVERMLAKKLLHFSQNGRRILIPTAEIRRVSKLSQMMEG